MNIEGIVLNVNQYREHDGMVTLLTIKGPISFCVYGIYSIKSKKNAILSPLFYGDFTFKDNNKNIFEFIDVNPILDTRKYFSDFCYLALINFINELTLKVLKDEDYILIYPFLKAILKTFDNKDFLLSNILIYTANVLKIAGLGLNVNECVITKKTTDLIGLSLNDGGVISKAVFDSNKHIYYGKDKIEILQIIFNSDYKKYNQYKFENKYIKNIINDLLIFADNELSYKFKSKSLLDVAI